MTKAAVRLCINSQTPLVRFKQSYAQLLDKYGTAMALLRLEKLKEGVDYEYSPGGVTAMIYPAVKKMLSHGYIGKPSWISLGPGAPERMSTRDATIYNVGLDQDRLLRYANFKEGIWNEIHGIDRPSFKPEEYEAYVQYNWLCAKIMLEMLKDIDIFWIHDFQQLLLGNLIGPSAPAVLRWHIPFRIDHVSERLRVLIMKNIEGFDAVVVSTKKDLEGLIHAGYRGRAYAQNPYLDPTVCGKAESASVDFVRNKFGVGPDDKVLLVVARMDPVKSQDVAIKATARLTKQFRNVKLILAGNGSFTGSSKGGLGHPKAGKWRTYLERIARELKVTDSVIFTGHLPHEEVDALYTTCDATIIPSAIEGFNLTAVEAWIHKKPSVVSKGAGVSELVHDEVNGFKFNPRDHVDLAEKLGTLLKSPSTAEKMGENGSGMTKHCYVDNAIDSIKQVFDDVSKMY